jgi:hypothetical protein
MLQDLPNYPFIIISALIGVLCAYRVYRYKSKSEAARSFREGVIDELKEFYPPPGNCLMGFEGKLDAAMARVEILVKKLGYYVPRRKRRGYDSAWKDLKIHCLEITSDKCSAYTMFPSMRRDDEKNPKEVFYEKVENLLKQASDT